MTEVSERIPASIELSSRQVLGGALTSSFLPPGTRVYLTDIGTDGPDDLVAAARHLSDGTSKPVVHIPVRRVASGADLQDRLDRLSGEAGVRDVLVIAGDAARAAGPFEGSIDAIRTGSFDRAGITQIGIAGHPEGNAAYREASPDSVLAEKAALANASDAQFRIVTQFGFDGMAFVTWSRAIADAGIDLPVHLGIAGPAKITTLLKFAATCGVGNSARFLRRQTSAVASLVKGYSPEDVALPIERAWAEDDRSNIAGLHVFPFGGLASASDWLFERGSFLTSAQPGGGQ